MSAPHRFFRNTYDKYVAGLDEARVEQMILEYDDFERRGVLGETALRDEGEAIMAQIDPGRGADTYTFIQLAAACHKRRSISPIENPPELEDGLAASMEP